VTDNPLWLLAAAGVFALIRGVLVPRRAVAAAPARDAQAS
jgi:hypothetical protein